MGVQTAVFSKVGDDPNGKFILAELSRAGVETSGIRLSPTDSTPFTFVGVHADGDRTFILTPGSNQTLAPADFDIDTLLDADYLLYQDCWLQPALDGAPGAEILAEAKRRGVVTLLDACWGMGPNRPIFETMLPHCDYVMPSVDDLRVIYPGLSAEEIAAHILNQGTGTVVLKMGPSGSMIATRAGIEHVQALPAQVVDTTGAGDCWDAGFIAALSKGNDVIKAAKIGHACAACCVEHLGGATGIPDYESVLQRTK